MRFHFGRFEGALEAFNRTVDEFPPRLELGLDRLLCFDVRLDDEPGAIGCYRHHRSTTFTKEPNSTMSANGFLMCS